MHPRARQALLLFIVKRDDALRQTIEACPQAAKLKRSSELLRASFAAARTHTHTHTHARTHAHTMNDTRDVAIFVQLQGNLLSPHSWQKHVLSVSRFLTCASVWTIQLRCWYLHSADDRGARPFGSADGLRTGCDA